MSITTAGTIRVCVRDLSQRLARRYGVRDAYAPSEIESVLKQWNMHLSHTAYAYAIFGTRADFERLDPALRAGRDYDEWRRDVQRRYPRIDEVRPRDVIAFARNWWARWGRPVTTIDLPDSFAPDQPGWVPRPEYREPEFGFRGIALALAAGVSAIIGLAILVAWRLHG